MAVCAFVASGLNFDVDAYLKKSPFKAATVFHKGQIPPKDNPQRIARPDSGFVVLVNDRPGDLSSAQIEEVIMFLFKHEKELDRMKSFGVDNMLLDFGVDVAGRIQPSQYLPPELIVTLGRFRMGLIFSPVQFPKG